MEKPLYSYAHESTLPPITVEKSTPSLKQVLLFNYSILGGHCDPSDTATKYTFYFSEYEITQALRSVYKTLCLLRQAYSEKCQ